MAKNIVFKIAVLVFACLASLSFGAAVFAQTASQVQTNSATNIQNNSVVLNGYLSYYGGSNTTVYFQYGTTSSYGYQTNPLTENAVSNFSQSVTGLTPNTTYHYRAVAQSGSGTTYGLDMTFYTNGSNGGGSATVTANAGPSLYLTSGQNAILQGSAYDSMGYLLTYYWSCTGGTLSSFNIIQPNYTAPYISTPTTYTCTLTATDSSGNSNSSSTIIYLNSNGNGNGNNTVQTNSATNVYNNSATLNGYLNGNNYYNTYVYFQYGTTTGYGSQTTQQYLTGTGAFSQIVTGLYQNTTYHFRAVAQTGSSGLVYGNDMTFYSSGNGNNGYYGNGSLYVTKQVINLTSGNLNWQPSVSAKSGDILSFAVTLQPNSTNINNVYLRDILPVGLIYRGNMAVNTNTNYGGDITAGLNIGTLYANQPTIVTYQAQVATTYSSTLTNNVTVTSNEAGTQTASASVFVTNTPIVYNPGRPTYISTAETNNFLTDSFFLPLLLIVLMAWLFFSGRVYKFADWMKSKI